MTAVLAERERLGSTAIGDGIAIPHGKLPKVTKILGTFGRHVQGVDFESLDGNPTHLFFMLVAPEDSTSLHLKALARVSRLLRDGNFREKLLSAPDSERTLPPDSRGRQQVLVRAAAGLLDRKRGGGFHTTAFDRRHGRVRRWTHLGDARARGSRLLLRR